MLAMSYGFSKGKSYSITHVDTLGHLSKQHACGYPSAFVGEHACGYPWTFLREHVSYELWLLKGKII